MWGIETFRELQPDVTDQEVAGLPPRAADWMRQARRDLQHAQDDLEGGYFEWACFSAHQAAEKAVKALFQHLHGEARGHSVAGLLKALGIRVAVPEDLREAGMRRERLLPDGDTLNKVVRYEAHLNRQLYQALHELEALQARRRGLLAPLARLEVHGLPEG